MLNLGGSGIALESEILTLLKGLMEAKALGLSNLVVEGDSAIVSSWIPKKKKDSWRLHRWPCQIFDIVTERGCSIQQVPSLANYVAAVLGKREAKH